MEIKRGYKQTDVGIIPEDWDVQTLGNVSEKIMVGIASAATHAYRTKGIPLLRNQNIKEGYLDDSDILFVDVEYEKVFRNKRLRAGDLLTARTGYPGMTCIVPPKYDSAQSFTTLIIRPKTTDVESSFLCAFINSTQGQRFFEKSQIGGAQKNVNAGTLRKMPVPVPHPSEQRAIAEALSDIDALLIELNMLIAKKHDLKQAAMQQLLTGQTRLPSFHDEWEEKRFGELTVPRSERVDPRRSGVHEFCVELEHIESGTGQLLGAASTNENSSLKSVFREGDVLFGKLRAYLQKYWLATKPGVCSTEIWVFTPNTQLVTSAYLYQLVRVDRFIETASTAYGTHMPRSDWNVVKNYELRLPTIAEQTIIAEVLTEMDKELKTLEQRREKTRALKQAMMQELLTGRIRLVQDSKNVISFPSMQIKATKTSHNWQIDEAVIIGVLAGQFGTEEWPLPRKRRVKLTYLLHRHAQRQTDDYLKMAAGPYNPKTKYQGPEKIAIQNGYAQEHHNGKYAGFIAGESIAQADNYFAQWYPGAKKWLEQFRFEKTDELELLATVDMAMEDLRKDNKPIVLDMVKQLIHDHPEWEAKLDREIFSDDNITRAMQKCGELFQ